MALLRVHRLRALPHPMPMPMLEHIRAAFADKAVRCLALDRRRRSDEPTTVHRWLLFLLLVRCASTRACEENELPRPHIRSRAPR